MTLKARNSFTLILSTFFLAVSTAALLFYLYKLNIIHKGQAMPNFTLSIKDFAPFSNSFFTLCLETLCIMFYIPAAAFFIYARFEKTPSNEVAYFVVFLLGCVPELFRLCVPLEIMQGSYPSLLVIAGRALFWGRTLSFVSLFAASLLAAPNKSMNAEQNIFLLLVFSLTLASFAPVNTAKISASFNVQTGWTQFFYLLFGAAAALTMISYAMNAWSNENPIFIKMGVDVLCIEAGLLAINSSAIFAAALLGVFLLYAGTIRYFYNLHKIYA